jgi:hypothetical protein
VSEKVSSLPGETPAETCRRLGWTVGTTLVGDEGYGPTAIVITAIGDAEILARELSHAGEPVSRREGMWSLDCRDWQVVLR